MSLNSREFFFAVERGALREAYNRQIGRVRRWKQKEEDGWRDHICGACAEFLVAKTLNVHWTGAFTFDTNDVYGDVGPYQVRHTEYATGGLVLHEDDHPDKPYILVTGDPPKGMIIRGWLYGREYRLGKWKKDWREPAWCVPQNKLRSMDDLPLCALSQFVGGPDTHE